MHPSQIMSREARCLKWHVYCVIEAILANVAAAVGTAGVLVVAVLAVD